MIKKIILNLGVYVFFATLLPCYLATLTYAQSPLSLTVSPARTEIELAPGQTKFLNIDFYNQGDIAIFGYIKKSSGDLPVSAKYSASLWINILDEEVELVPGEKTTIGLQINVPENARPGGKYVSVFFDPAEDKYQNSEKSSLLTIPRLVSLVYIKVGGKIVEKASVTRFTGPDLVEYGPVKIETTIFNQGDYHIRPKGVINLVDMFGRVVDQVVLEEKNIFPETNSQYTNYVGEGRLFGRYKASLAASYGEKGQVLTKTVYLWIIPWKIITIILIPLIIIAFLKI